MGIRFLCTACEKKLNVKSFLAGKKGVCPKCGASIQIPLESEILSKKEAAAMAAGGEAAMSAPVATEQPMQAFAGAAVAEAPTVPTQAPAQAATPTPMEQPVAPVPAQAPVQPQAAAAPVAPNPQPVAAPAIPAAIPGAAGMPTPAPTPATAAPAPPSAPQPDPIHEDPNLVWYVRPPSGGQFGPAKGDIMLKWIDEGRVSEDSLVWREGWADWKKASEVIPSLSPAGVGAPATGDAQVVSARPSSSSAANAHRSRRKKNSQMALFSVIMLVFVSIALLVTLIVKLSGGG